MRKIKLTQGKTVKVSDEDYEYLNQFKWHYNNGYAKRTVKCKRIYMHKVILGRMGVALKKYLKIQYKLDYCRGVLIPPLDLSPGIKEIPLTQGKVTIVDSEDYEYLMQFKWYYGNHGYAVQRKHGKVMLMHRVILERMGIKDFEQVDHVDRNELNNRRENLRAATHSENLRNQKKYVNSSSKYKGVCWHKTRNKWAAQIQVNGKRKYLGRFISEEDAALAYNKAARKYFGEFAFLNEVRL